LFHPSGLDEALRGLEIADDAGAVMRIYGSEPVRDGLALLKEAFLLHYQSPGHPETAAIDLVAARYQAEGVGYRPLRDGQALLINGADSGLCSPAMRRTQMTGFTRGARLGR
jgi:dipeptidase E